MSRCVRVLVVEDVPPLAETYRLTLRKEGYEVAVAHDGAEALDAMRRSAPDILLLDVNLPDMSGLDIMRAARAQRLAAESIMMTAQGSVQLAVEAMREGAFDFLMKPFNAERLRTTVRNALERRPAELAEPARANRDGFAGFIGRSAAMEAVYRMLESAAPSNATVFITGESGTGKELCADALHKLSRRRAGPLVALNCAAIPRDMLESELFGHVKGAFTGAVADRKGAVMRADGGTLFLDEICEMDLTLQAKLLRFLQTRLVQAVGEDTPRPADVRIVCATNRDPEAEVAVGRLREDLFYRLHVVPLHLPPLREREGDALLIAERLLDAFAREDGKTFTGFSPEAARLVAANPWPGNVRQLQNAVRNVVVMQGGPIVEAHMLPLARAAGTVAASPVGPAPTRHVEAPAAPVRSATVLPLDFVIKGAIERAIEHFEGNIPRAAAALEVAPSTIYRRLQIWGAAAGGLHGRASAGKELN